MTLLSIDNLIESKTKKSIMREVGERVGKVTYFEAIPLNVMGEILGRYNIDSAPLDGIYCWREGTASTQLGKNFWIYFTWYKMNSGKYETVCYIS